MVTMFAISFFASIVAVAAYWWALAIDQGDRRDG